MRLVDSWCQFWRLQLKFLWTIKSWRHDTAAIYGVWYLKPTVVVSVEGGVVDPRRVRHDAPGCLLQNREHQLSVVGVADFRQVYLGVERDTVLFHLT